MGSMGELRGTCWSKSKHKGSTHFYPQNFDDPFQDVWDNNVCESKVEPFGRNVLDLMQWEYDGLGLGYSRYSSCVLAMWIEILDFIVAVIFSQQLIWLFLCVSGCPSSGVSGWIFTWKLPSWGQPGGYGPRSLKRTSSPRMQSPTSFALTARLQAGLSLNK